MIKPIIDFDGYFVSDDGRILCNLGRGNRRDIKNTTIDLYEIKPRPNKQGYMRVYMRNTKTNKRMDRYVHRLVAEYFVENPYNKKYVDHINCKRNDNRASNLQWVTAKENTDKTLKLNHTYRDVDGRYVSNFDYKTA